MGHTHAGNDLGGYVRCCLASPISLSAAFRYLPSSSPTPPSHRETSRERYSHHSAPCKYQPPCRDLPHHRQLAKGPRPQDPSPWVPLRMAGGTGWDCRKRAARRWRSQSPSVQAPTPTIPSSIPTPPFPCPSSPARMYSISIHLRRRTESSSQVPFATPLLRRHHAQTRRRPWR